MEEVKKLPLKRVELSLTKFNEVAIPHHLDLLRQHKANIIKYEESGDYGRVRSEQTHARRVTTQLRSLLSELEALRLQVEPADLPKFDKLTQHSRDLTLKAIMDYLETSPMCIVRPPQHEQAAFSAVSTDSVGVVAHAEADATADSESQMRLQIQEQECRLRAREAALLGWSELQAELSALREVWMQLHRAAREQGEQVSAASDTVETAAENVEAARWSLASAEKLRTGAYGAGGAVLGAVVGGPVGMVVGAKAGAAAALAGSVLGYLGARVLGRTRRRQIDNATHDKQQ